MTDYPDGHGPETCNYTKCDSESDVPCPFVRDQQPKAEAPMIDDWNACTHDWRHMNVVMLTHMRFYCTKCLTLRDKPL